MLNRQLRLAVENSDPTADKPRCPEVGVECESPINQGNTGVVIASRESECKSRRIQRSRVVLAQPCGSPCEPGCFGGLLLMVFGPYKNHADGVTPRGHAIGRSKSGIELDCLVEQLRCFGRGLLAALMDAGKAA